LPVMNSVLRMSWTTISGMSFLWSRRWFFKMLLYNENFDDKHVSKIKVPVFRRSKWWLTQFFISSTEI
jgi:hypothetical protein